MKAIFRSFRSSLTSPPAPPSFPPSQNSGLMTEASATMPRDSLKSMKPLTIVELFQSQGCNSCPPANANLLDLTQNSCPPSQTLARLPANEDSNTLLLTYHVTYWDYLGWPDTFADHDFDERQRNYVRRMGLRSAFTPQVIVNGRSSGVGSSKSDLARVLREGGAGHALPAAVSVESEEETGDVVVSVNAPHQGSGPALDVLVVWYDPSDRDVKIGRGENAGKTLPHRNIVRHVQRFGVARAGEEGVVVIERHRDGLEGVVLVQEGPGGKIVGAARI